MYRELGHQMNVIGQSDTRVVAVSNNKRYHYPWKLCHVGYISETQRQQCYTLYMDSDKSDPSVTNEHIHEKAVAHNVDVVIPKDYLGDRYETHESMKQFHRLTQQESIPGCRTYAVLQPPFGQVYSEFEEFYSQFNHFALGGLQGLSPLEQISQIKRFHQVSHDNITVHGFGVGTDQAIIKACREEDRFLDSLDIGTPELSAANHNILDARMSQFDFKYGQGDDVSTVRAGYTKAMLIMLNYVLGPLVNEEFINELYDTYESLEKAAAAHQSGLGEFIEATSNTELSAP